MIPPAQLESSLRRIIRQALKELQQMPEPPGDLEIPLDLPRQAVHGDLATSAALQMASRLKRPPMEIAHALGQKVDELLRGSDLAEGVERIEVKPPGFINFTLSRAFLYAVLRQVLREGSSYGRGDLGKGRRVLLEFVSANPTGPLSVAHGRQAAVGDALANVLEFSGYVLTREYYLNDEGLQIDLLGQSVLERAKEKLGLKTAGIPEGGYKGAYIVTTSGCLLQRKGDEKQQKDFVQQPDASIQARDFAVKEYTETIRRELEGIGVQFGVWTTQSSFTSGGNRRYLDGSLEQLRERGYLYEQDGALWLKSTEFGDDKDRVVRRSDGRLTYIAPDIAYHRQKYERGFTLLINLWGPDHHGYIPRLKAAMEALGFDPNTLQIRIIQHCTLKRGKETVPMSTREGQYVTLQQVVQEVGRDAARFFFLLRKSDAHLEFDLELAKKHSLENPVYYIQYAHARISNIFETAKKQGLTLRLGCGAHERLEAPEELALLRLLRRFLGVVAGCARSLEPFGVVAYLQELAEALHRFYDVHRVIGTDPDLTAARSDLVAAVRTVLGNGLRLLGVSAPTQM